MYKIFIFILAFLLTGCETIQRMSSGSYIKTPMLNDEGKLVTDNFGRPVYVTESKSKSEGVFESATEAISELPNEVEQKSPICGGFTLQDIVQLSPSFQGNIAKCFEIAEQNRPFEILGEALALAISDYKSTAHAIFAEAKESVRDIQQASLGKFQAVANAGPKIALTVEGGRTIRQGYKSNENIASKQTGNYTTGDINISTSQNSDGTSSGGTLASEEGTSSSGSETAADISKTGDTPTVIIGAGNNFATDSSFAGDGPIQFLETDAVGNLNNDSKTNAGQAAGQIEGDNKAEDSDGIKF